MSWLITGAEKTPVDPLFNNVSLLLHGDGTNGSTTILDSSPTPKTVTAVGNAQISTAQSKFGGASIGFDGNGDYLTTTNDTGLGAGDFTIELSFYVVSVATGQNYLFGYRPNVTNGPYPDCWVNGTNIEYYVNTGARITVSGATAGQWHHLAIVRFNGKTNIYLNGVKAGATYSDSSNYPAVAGRPIVGGNPFGGGSGNNFNGYIDELRITKGIARYTTNFTPLTAPFPDI